MRPFIDVVVPFVPFILVLIVGGVTYILIRQKGSRDTKILLLAVFICSIIILSQSVFRPANTDQPSPAENWQTTEKNLQLPCGVCERPNVTATLSKILMKPGTTDAMFRFQFTNTASEHHNLQFESLKLSDSNGNDYPGQGEPFLISPHQSATVNVLFQGVQSKVPYTLKLVVERPHAFKNFYQTAEITLP